LVTFFFALQKESNPAAQRTEALLFAKACCMSGMLWMPAFFANPSAARAANKKPRFPGVFCFGAMSASDDEARSRYHL
jgi:hypothetical protein